MTYTFVKLQEVKVVSCCH